ncbi:MAG: ABC transporter permease [Burkholderiales bacterium]
MSLLRVPGSLGRAVTYMSRVMARHRTVLIATLFIELRKRYAGSTIGAAWLVLHPILLLSVYLFVFLVVFRVRFPGYSDFGYVLYVFTGLVPYLGLSEAISTGSLSIKANAHLVRNVMLPIELIPVRTVATSLAMQFAALGVVIVLAAAGGELTPKIVALPVVLALQFLMVLGIVLAISAIAVFVQDIAYFINLALILLMFVSPIGFRPEMLPIEWHFLLWINPLHYMTDAFRFSLLASHQADPRALVGFGVLAVSLFAMGGALFLRLRSALIDYE